jgi:SAM-dependent methyltransferase
MTTLSPAPQKELYEEFPYPNVPIDTSAQGNPEELYKVSLTTAQYARTHQVIDSEGALILNAGCGSGWETLFVAEANPGARVIGVDLSPESVKMAEKRLKYHGFWDSEFHVLNILDLDRLGVKFDFISCNDVLYLLDHPLDGFKALSSVLKPEGIIRTNLHHYYGRRAYLDMQELFQSLGQYTVQRQKAMSNVKEFMMALQPNLPNKQLWNQSFESDPNKILNNFLLENDKGFKISEVFNFLEEAKLGLVDLVDRASWDLASLFQGEIPAFFQEKLQEMTQVEQLHLFELIAPTAHRLVDFWAEHQGSSLVFPWSDEDWMNGEVQINPVMIGYSDFHAKLKKALEKKVDLSIPWVGAKNGRLTFKPDQIKWLSLLLSGSVPVRELIQHEMTQTKKDEESVVEDLLPYLQALEDYLFLFLKPGS